jgi:raffinose/stachyose/melibiose transport system permease protein
MISEAGGRRRRLSGEAAKSGPVSKSHPTGGRQAWAIPAWLRFVLPALILYGVIVLLPIVGGIPLSFVSWNGVSRPIFNGLANFRSIIHAGFFFTALLHVVIITAMFVVLANTVGLGLAVLLNSRPKGYRIYQTLIFLPVVVSLVATGFIWTLMLDPTIGLIPSLTQNHGPKILNQLWLANPRIALFSVIMVAWWQWGGIPILIYGAGLRGVPGELLEAADIDGASRARRFWRITVPLLRPATAVITILLFITVAQTFDVVYVLEGAQGAPAGATDVFGTLIYRTAFGVGPGAVANLGLGEAVAVVVMVLLAVTLGIIQWYFRRRTVKL